MTMIQGFTFELKKKKSSWSFSNFSVGVNTLEVCSMVSISEGLKNIKP